MGSGAGGERRGTGARGRAGGGADAGRAARAGPGEDWVTERGGVAARGGVARRADTRTMPIWCKMFRQTLGGAARNWFDDLDPKSMDSFEELSQKFLEEFSQQKRYAKDPTEIHGIMRRPSEGLQIFMDRFKSESSHIKGVPPVLRISAFMLGHGHPELAKKLNDKIPKMVDEMFERVRAFIREEVAASSVEMVRSPQWDKGNTRPVWSGGQEKARNRSGPMELQRNSSSKQFLGTA
ncbi:reverse transcriptase domain-containing protein [Tanacetum coccineum]